MSDDPKIDDAPASDNSESLFENVPLAETAQTPEPPVTRGIGWGGALGLFVLASALGAAGGWAASYYVMPPKVDAPITQSVDLAPLTARISEAERKITGQGAQLKLLQSEINNRPASIEVRAKPSPDIASGGDDAAATVGIDTEMAPLIETLRGQVAGMETALETLRADVKSQASRPTASLDIAAAPNETPADLAATLPDERITLLQDDVTNLRARIDGLETGLSGVETNLGETRMQLSETRAQLSDTMAIAAAPTIVKETVLLPPFPRDVVFDALTTEPAKEDAGWMSKTLNKHISVRNPDDVKAAQRRLNVIAEAIELGEIDKAISAVEAMPAAAQAKAAEWLAAAKRQ